MLKFSEQAVLLTKLLCDTIVVGCRAGSHIIAMYW